ncbi:MAG TPA: hypothetical protein VFM14_08775 [Gemmatimonadales bacterium]|nr:hypothetical protein [Gemmatimonadales bacterium]
MFAAVDRWVQRIDRQRSVLPLFAALGALLLLQMWPAAWNGNEEAYFQLGYRTFAPESFPQFHAAFDTAYARVVPMYLLGAAVHLLGYDGAHQVARILMAILYAAGLAYFFSALRFSVWDALLVVVAFILAGERLMGGEWLFRGVESRTMAYGLLFFGFGFALRRRWIAATITGAAATYMHFLVGGFWTAMILVQQWLETRQRRELGRVLAVYVILTLPLAWLIVRDQVIGATPAHGLAEQIYAARAAWHVAPFRSRGALWNWMPGIVSTVALLLVLGAAGRHHRSDDRAGRLVRRTALLGLAYLLVALVAAFADRHTQILAKFYVFRPSTLTLFLSITTIVALLSEWLVNSAAAVESLVVFALVVSVSWQTLRMQVDRSREAVSALPQRGELVAAIESHTAPGDVVLIEPVREFDVNYISLHRQIPRPTLVTRKFVPSNWADVLRWHSYLEIRKAVFANGCPARTPIPIRWLVTLQAESAARLASCGPPVWRKANVALIPVRAH